MNRKQRAILSGRRPRGRPADSIKRDRVLSVAHWRVVPTRASDEMIQAVVAAMQVPESVIKGDRDLVREHAAAMFSWFGVPEHVLRSDTYAGRGVAKNESDVRHDCLSGGTAK